MPAIPLIRASQAEPFTGALAAAGTRIEPLLEDCGIRADIPALDPDALVPEYAIWDLVETCARVAGDGLFGWRIGLDTPIEAIGAFGRSVGSAGTLRGALRLFLEAVGEHSSHARFSVVPAGERVWFCRHGIDGIDVGSWQVEQYVLGLMVRLVRLATGRAWSPHDVLLKQTSLRGRALPPALAAARVRLGSRVSAIGLPRTALDAPLGAAPLRGTSLEPIDTDFLGSLRLAVEPMLGTEAAGLERAARYAGVTPRTVQRWLEREGRSFSTVLEEVRRAAASRLLATTDLPLLAVAERLGYSDAANFTRAFRRWTGTTPGRWRARAASSR
jgi:AraC-like DNA-binding protein